MGYRENYIKNIPGRIKALRKAAGLTQEQFAAEADMSLCSIRKYEQGKSIPDLYALCKMCDFFKCDMDYLSGKYDAKKRSTQEIIDCIGLGESAINKLLEYNFYKRLEWNNVSRLLEMDFFRNYIIGNGYTKTENGVNTLDESDFYAMRAANREHLKTITLIINNGLIEAIEKYIKHSPTKDDFFLEYLKKEDEKAMLSILQKMQVEKIKEYDDLFKELIETENRGENRGELLQVSAAKDNT